MHGSLSIKMFIIIRVSQNFLRFSCLNLQSHQEKSLDHSPKVNGPGFSLDEIISLAWASGAYILANEGELLKVLFEQLRQVGGLLVIAVLVDPGVARLQDLSRDAWAGRWNLQAKDGIGHDLRLLNIAINRGLDHLARVVDVDTRANAI